MHVYISRSCKQAVVIKQLCRTVVKMSPCFCDRLHKTDKPTVKAEYAFSGSLCRICEFKTADCVRYCITIFSLSNYKYLHFPHEEYKLLIKNCMHSFHRNRFHQPRAVHSTVHYQLNNYHSTMNSK